MVANLAIWRWVVLPLLVLCATVPLTAQHTPAISAGATLINGYDHSGAAIGGALRLELPVVQLSERVSMIVGAGGWLAIAPGAVDGPRRYTTAGGGAFVGLTSAHNPGRGLTATITAGLDLLDAPEPSCGLAPPGGCSPPPDRGNLAMNLGFRVHHPIDARVAFEGGFVLARHELRVEPRWGSRLEFGLRLGMGRQRNGTQGGAP